MNWKCKLGFHDWYQDRVSHMCGSFHAVYYDRNFFGMWQHRVPGPCQDAVCRRCDKTDLSYSAAVEEGKKELQAKEAREAQERAETALKKLKDDELRNSLRKTREQIYGY